MCVTCVFMSRLVCVCVCVCACVCACDFTLFAANTIFIVCCRDLVSLVR